MVGGRLSVLAEGGLAVHPSRRPLIHSSSRPRGQGLSYERRAASQGSYKLQATSFKP